MKKYIIVIAALMTIVMSSCSDMLESDSERQIFDLNLNQKTDSLFFTFGLMNAMQQLADQYVIQNEMRGDLVTTTSSTDKNLRQMYNLTATASNKYDSAYVYYRVINNCNYYVTHRDTTLMTGSQNVVINEYAAVKAMRAWAYLQLARVYGKVPFFTEPLTKISQIDNNNYPELDIAGIVSQLAPDLEQYTGLSVPSYGAVACGSTNYGSSKTAMSALCFIPVDVILGDMYLEVGDYANATRHFYTYLYNKKAVESPYYSTLDLTSAELSLPSDFTFFGDGHLWSSIFAANATTDIISYIPMSVNKLSGPVTGLPLLFGYNYYSTSTSADSLWKDNVQIVPSSTFNAIADSSDYYYQSTTDILGRTVNSVKMGDMRRSAVVRQTIEGDTSITHIRKYMNGNIILYRNTTVYLHLAEALNRLGYPDAAFAILKDGLKNKLLNDTTYIKPSTKNLLSTTYPFFSEGNMSIFDDNTGVHQHGCGYASGAFSPYQMDTIVGMKMKEIANKFNVSVGTTKADTINAMEDILCDEYAMEFAFEGCRMSDLCRMARHKNNGNLYGSNFGGIWLAEKFAFKNLQKDLKNQSNWYLPFK
jgi:hypothetical protein